MLRTVKVGDILIVYPSKERVKVTGFIKGEATTTFLRDYWRKKHNIKIPTTFRIAVCRFATTILKEYNYPLYRKCVKKPLFQYNHKKMWEIDRQYLLFKRRKGDEIDDNKGNWHPPSDYTMYQMGF